MKQVILLLFVALMLPCILPAQFIESFTDGNIIENPTWFGQVDAFQVDNEVLQLFDQNATSNNTSYIYTPVPVDDAELISWECYVRTDFAPSGSNFATIVLNANQTSFEDATEAFYLKIGGISGSDDAIELFHRTAGSDQLVLSGMTGSAGTNPVEVRVRISRTANGDWELATDYTGGTDFTVEANANNAASLVGQFFGLECTYTSSRNESFFFDDIIINGFAPDETPPVLVESNVMSSTEVELIFNELMNIDALQNTANYSIDNGIGNPNNTSVDPNDPTRVVLTLNNPLQSTIEYTLTISNVSDFASNVLNTSTTLQFFEVEEALPGDWFITELMVDPTPPQGLPGSEYIELFNASDKILNLNQLQISTGNSPKILPDAMVFPNTYVILCNANVAAEFETFGQVAGISSPPALTNSGGDLILSSTQNVVFESISYTNDWYRDNIKDDGGYSLERTNLTGDPNCSANWIASNSADGGTPGSINSVDGLEVDTEAPDFTTLQVIDASTLQISLNEAAEVASVEDLSIYSISPSISILQITLQLPERTEIIFELAEDIQVGQQYELTIAPGITDCAGNLASDNRTTTFALPEAPLTGDIIINEILFNPSTGGVDFIEFYNRSNKFINLNEFAVGNKAKQQSETVEIDFLFPPQSYLVFTEDIDDIKSRYTILDNDAFFEHPIPSLDDKEGNVTIRWRNISLDSFNYFELYHFPLLEDKNGVSLERIDFDAPTAGSGNWHSAAATAGFATPGYQNSQSRMVATPDHSLINIPETTFSPNEDGDRDVLLMNYALDDPGHVLNLQIFDTEGRLINRLYNNEFLSIEGVLQWDGTTMDGMLANKGIYILWIELITPDGAVNRHKEVVVLAK